MRSPLRALASKQYCVRLSKPLTVSVLQTPAVCQTGVALGLPLASTKFPFHAESVVLEHRIANSVAAGLPLGARVRFTVVDAKPLSAGAPGTAASV